MTRKQREGGTSEEVSWAVKGLSLVGDMIVTKLFLRPHYRSISPSVLGCFFSLFFLFSSDCNGGQANNDRGWWPAEDLELPIVHASAAATPYQLLAFQQL